MADRWAAAQFTSLASSLPVSLAGYTRSVAHYRREVLQGVGVNYDHFRLVQLTSKFAPPPHTPAIAADWVSRGGDTRFAGEYVWVYVLPHPTSPAALISLPCRFFTGSRTSTICYHGLSVYENLWPAASPYSAMTGPQEPNLKFSGSQLPQRPKTTWWESSREVSLREWAREFSGS